MLQNLRSVAVHFKCDSLAPLLLVALSTLATADENEQRTDTSEGKDAWITFLSHRSGDNLLYKMRPDGTELTPIFGGELKDVPGLRDGMKLYREPHFTRQSPDRRYFLSWTSDMGRPKGTTWPHFLLRLGKLDGGGPTRIVAAQCEEICSWSPDGKQIAWSRLSGNWRAEPRRHGQGASSTEVMVVNTDGTNPRRVLEKAGVWHVTDWSPDGKRLLLEYKPAVSTFYGSADMLEFDLERALKEAELTEKRLGPSEDWPGSLSADMCLKRVTTGGWYQSARYSPDGRQIAVVRRRVNQSGLSVGELVLLDARSQRGKVIASYANGIRGPICWSPNSSKILFSRYLDPDDKRERTEGGLAIWSVNSDGTNARFFTTGWSPDWR